jgi:hypothetical protein
MLSPGKTHHALALRHLAGFGHLLACQQGSPVAWQHLRPLVSVGAVMWPNRMDEGRLVHHAKVEHPVERQEWLNCGGAFDSERH